MNTSMTTEELRVKLCEWDGWKDVRIRTSFGEGILTGYPPTASGLLHEAPKLTLDYVATIEAKLTDEEHARFSASLRDLTYDIDVAKWNRAYISPSKEQRATAILRAVGKGDK